MSLPSYNRKLKCSGCGETDKNLLNHIDTALDHKSKRAHGINIYRCMVCNEEFTRRGCNRSAEGEFVVNNRYRRDILEDGFFLMFGEYDDINYFGDKGCI